ncbi:MAG: DNA gyrase C-terminal beta-propeller domain-containing protein [Candidatus Nanopelagicales bacterium]
MVSAKGMSVRFRADSLRAMGRATSGVFGMRFRGDDYLLAMDVVRDGCDLVTVTDEGFAKRTPLSEWEHEGRGGLGVVAMKLVAERGLLVGALVRGEPRRFDLRHREQRRGDPHAGRGHPADRPADDGRQSCWPRRWRHGGRGGPLGGRG